MSALAGPFAVVAAVLVQSGATKLWRPDAAGEVLRALRLPAGPLAGRALGLCEVAVGAAAVFVGGRVSGALLGATYLAFAVVIAVLLRRGGVSSCGCFGTQSSPPTVVHLGFDVAFASIGVAVAVFGVPSLPDTVAGQPWYGLPFLGLVSLGTWLAIVGFTVLPDTLVATRRTPPAARVQEFELTGPFPGASAPPSPRPAP